MGTLRRDLHKLCAQHRDGSYQTQADRLGVLMLCERQLKEMGYGFKSARGLKPKHRQDLVDLWLAEDLSPATIKNRAAVLRWWATKVGKASIVPRDNAALGIPARKMHASSKAKTLSWQAVAKIDCPRMRMSLRLMAAFGLRRKEALMFRPGLADAGDHIALQPTWTKGGRPRVVPILSQRQRELLDEAIALVGNDSLIPNNKSRKQHLDAFKYATLKAGITNVHGLRHKYAQERYRSLTGLPCPAAGGPHRDELSPVEREHDAAARAVLSEELGHGRPEITRAYLG